MQEQIEVRKFYPEQTTGLNEIGWTFQMEVLPLSVNQLLEGAETGQLFRSVYPLEYIGDIVPVAREVRIDPARPFVFGTANLSFEDQNQRVDEYVRELRSKPLRTGTLDGVDFGMDRVSVVAQLDRGYERRFGRKLFVTINFDRELLAVPEFTSTIDEVFINYCYFGDENQGKGYVGHAEVGRVLDRYGLTVLDGNALNPNVTVLLVATPAGDR